MERNVYQSEQVRSPFILGFIRPKIYIPFGLEENIQRYVVAHERYHLRRLDHMVKPLAFLLLTIHWFNPLCWLAFNLMSREMEMSCDEKVLSDFGKLSEPKSEDKAFTGQEYDKNVLSWEKPAIWLTIVAVLLCMAAYVALVSNPEQASNEFSGKNYKVKEVIYESLILSSLYDMRTSFTCTVTSDNVVTFKHWNISEEKWQETLDCRQYAIQLGEENFVVQILQKNLGKITCRHGK